MFIMKGGQSEKTKVVVRHLPPTISHATFLEQIDVVFSGRYHWVSFRPGKSSQKHQSYSRAYIDFKRPEDVLEFAEFFNGHVFINEKGTQIRAVVEYAPSQCVPKQRSKKDGREGTLSKDPVYLEFLKLISTPTENLPSAEIQLERREAEQAGAARDDPITTPLMDFVRRKRATKSSSRRQRILSNGKISKRAGANGRPNASLSKGSSEKKRVPSKMKKNLLENDATVSAIKKSQQREATGRIIKSILLNKDSRKNQSEQQIQSSKSNLKKDTCPPHPPHLRLALKDANGASDDKVVGNSLHSFSGEKKEKHTRKKDKPDHVVRTPLHQSDGSYASDEFLSSSALRQMESGVDSLQGKLGDVKVDPPISRSGVKSQGIGRSCHSSLDNRSHKHLGRHGPSSHIIKDTDVSSFEGKSSKRRGGASVYGPHEVHRICRSRCGFKNHVLVHNLSEKGRASITKFWACHCCMLVASRFTKQMIMCDKGLSSSEDFSVGNLKEKKNQV